MSQPVQFNFRSVDVPAASATIAFAINPQGDIVGRYALGTLTHGYLLSKGTVTTIDPPYGIGVFAAAQGINPHPHPSLSSFYLYSAAYNTRDRKDSV
jgi:hypothetical protein